MGNYMRLGFGLLLLACGGEDSQDFTAQSVSPVAQPLCITRQDDDIFGSITIEDDAECNELPGENSFEIYKEQPYIVSLSGTPGQSYCVDVHRESGYITISHETGTVTRNGNLFTWCVVHGDYEAERMLIRSLTPSAHVTLAVE